MRSQGTGMGGEGDIDGDTGDGQMDGDIVIVGEYEAELDDEGNCDGEAVNEGE